MSDFSDLGWISGPWLISSVTGSPGVGMNDVLYFQSTTIEIQRSNETQTETMHWATSCRVTNDGGLSGTRSSDGQTFVIKRDPSTGLLTCTFSDNTQQQRIQAVTLGTLIGTLAGTLAGLIGGSPLLGGVVGLIAALTGSATTAGASSLQSRTESGGTFVAEDGSTNRKPYPLQAMSA